MGLCSLEFIFYLHSAAGRADLVAPFFVPGYNAVTLWVFHGIFPIAGRADLVAPFFAPGYNARSLNTSLRLFDLTTISPGPCLQGLFSRGIIAQT